MTTACGFCGERVARGKVGDDMLCTSNGLHSPRWTKVVPRFKPGDRVVHLTSSNIPEGVHGTVVGECPQYLKPRYAWEVVYDGHPGTSPAGGWYSRDTSIELTTEAALAKARAAREKA